MNFIPQFWVYIPQFQVLLRILILNLVILTIFLRIVNLHLAIPTFYLVILTFSQNYKCIHLPILSLCLITLTLYLTILTFLLINLPFPQTIASLYLKVRIVSSIYLFYPVLETSFCRDLSNVSNNEIYQDTKVCNHKWIISIWIKRSNDDLICISRYFLHLTLSMCFPWKLQLYIWCYFYISTCVLGETDTKVWTSLSL